MVGRGAGRLGLADEAGRLAGKTASWGTGTDILGITRHTLRFEMQTKLLVMTRKNIMQMLP